MEQINNETIIGSSKQWFAFHVKPRHEKKASARLQDNFEIYCPLKEERVQWSDRWKTVTKPYIPGYIFAYVTESQRITVLNDPSIFRTVTWKGEPAVIREEEISTIKTVIGDPGYQDVSLQSFSRGDRVQVQSGKLQNLNGMVVSIKGDRACILLESMQCNMTFTILSSQLAAME